MKKMSIIMSILAMAVFPLSGCAKSQETVEYIKIPPDKAMEMIAAGEASVILDVRTEAEFASGHIEGAIVIPDTELEDTVEEIIPDKDQTILVYCRSGRRSAISARLLIEMGYTSVYDFGGILDWPYDIVTDQDDDVDVGQGKDPDENADENEDTDTGADVDGSKSEAPEDTAINGVNVIENQSFWVDLEDWGHVKFVSGSKQIDGLDKACFFLVDDKSNILFEFPDFYGNQWSLLDSIKAVSFKDANNDGYKDVIIIAEYMTGVGAEGAVPFNVGSIYFRKGNEFANDSSFDEKMNISIKNEEMDIKSILKYAEENLSE